MCINEHKIIYPYTNEKLAANKSVLHNCVSEVCSSVLLVAYSAEGCVPTVNKKKRRLPNGSKNNNYAQEGCKKKSVVCDVLIRFLRRHYKSIVLPVFFLIMEKKYIHRTRYDLIF